jgi:hypothetical protein
MRRFSNPRGHVEFYENASSVSTWEGHSGWLVVPLACCDAVCAHLMSFLLFLFLTMTTVRQEGNANPYGRSRCGW